MLTYNGQFQTLSCLEAPRTKRGLPLHRRIGMQGFSDRLYPASSGRVQRRDKKMKKLFKIIGFLLIALLACTSWADPVVPCNAGGNQLGLNACASKDFENADAELNSAYRRLLKKMADDPLFIKKLRVAQNAWIAFRDADLDARFSCSEGDAHQCWGSMYPMSFLSRKAELTRERTRHLQQILRDGSGQ